MTAITTNDSRRDDRVQDVLETSVPRAPIVVSADDQGVIELQRYFTRG